MNAKPNTKPMPLGRGLSALFGDADTSFQPRVAGAPVSSGADNEVRKIPTAWIQPGAFQPRRLFDEESLEELAASMKERGVIQPLVVRAIDGEKDSFEIIAGERRWRAAQLAGLHELPVIVRRFTDREAMEIGLIENVQRKDLSPLEEAEGYRRLLEEFHYSHDDISRVVGKSRPHISQFLRLLSLPQNVKKLITDGELTMGHARTLVTAKDPETLAREIVKKGLSVRQAEALARKAIEAVGTNSNRVEIYKGRDPNSVALEKRLEQYMGFRSRVSMKKGRGAVSFFFDDLDQLDAIIKKVGA